MADDRDRDCNGGGAEEEPGNQALLAEYSEMREEIRMFQEQISQRTTRGTAAVGLITGYALVAESGSIIIVFVPVIIAGLGLLQVKDIYSFLALANHVYKIEEQIPEDAFGWEHRFRGGPEEGGLLVIPWARYDNVNLFKVPATVVQCLTGITYVGFVGVSLIVVNNDVTEPIAGVDPVVIVGIAYLVLTTILVWVVLTSLTVWRKLDPSH